MHPWINMFLEEGRQTFWNYKQAEKEEQDGPHMNVKV